VELKISRTARCPSVPKVEVDQRSREARLRLEQVERLLTRGPRRLENRFAQGLFCSSIRPRWGELVRAASKSSRSVNGAASDRAFPAADA
jgi:hypothetical protein